MHLKKIEKKAALDQYSIKIKKEPWAYFNIYIELKIKVIIMNFVLFYPKVLSATLAQSGPLDFPSKKSFPLFFAHEKGLGHIFQK